MMVPDVSAVFGLLWLLSLFVPLTRALPADVSLSGNFRRPGFSKDSCVLPDVINVTITSDDVTISLEVSKSPRVTQDAPMYVIGDDGQVRQIAIRDRETYALYQDLETGSAILVTCPPAGDQKPAAEGTVTIEGRQFHLRHSSRRRRDVSSVTSESDEYMLTEVPEDPVKGQTIDYVLSPDDHSLPKLPSTSSPGMEQEELQEAIHAESAHHRLRRQAMTTQNVYIDVSVVIAFDIYQRFFNSSDELTDSEKEADALSSVKQEYALLMSEVDLHYQMIGSRLPYNISIGLASFVIAQSAAASPWTEAHRQTNISGQRYAVNTYSVWYALQAWVVNTSSLPAMDYYLLFTGYDLSVQGAGTTNLGLAYIGGVCSSSEGVTHPPGYNVAVIEDSHFSQTVIVTAHELGHALGALHDGEENVCRATDQYTMTPSVPGMTAANFGIFSPCTLRYFNATFDRLATSTQSESCIHEIISPAGVPNVTDLVPGQVYDVQTQCKRAFGNASFVCPGLTVVGDTMCSRTFCSNPLNPGTCNWIALYRGTTCGNRKWCVNAFCRSAPDASEMDESCPFGDSQSPPYADTNRSCSQVVREEPSRCYEDYFLIRCCQSCARIRRNVPGCEYGNKLSICGLALCRIQSMRETCCDSCSAYLTTTASNNTTPTPTTSTTTTATNTTSTTVAISSTSTISATTTTTTASTTIGITSARTPIASTTTGPTSTTTATASSSATTTSSRSAISTISTSASSTTTSTSSTTSASASSTTTSTSSIRSTDASSVTGATSANEATAVPTPSGATATASIAPDSATTDTVSSVTASIATTSAIANIGAAIESTSAKAKSSSVSIFITTLLSLSFLIIDMYTIRFYD